MKPVNITKEGIIECYGNRAGFVKEKTAVIDEMFKRDEVSECLQNDYGFEVAWENGVFDRLIKGEIRDSIMLKSCRVHQLKPGTDMRMKFISYDDLINKGYGEPDIKNYRTVYDGDINTNNLEEIYDKFNNNKLPSEYTGYAMSISDVIELYDDSGSEFYYVDSTGFIKLDMSSLNEKQEIEKSTPKDAVITENKSEAVIQRKETPELQIESPDEQGEFQPETFKISM